MINLVKKRVLVGITGASGAIYGVRLIEALGEYDLERHLIVSKWGMETLHHEMNMTIKDLESHAEFIYDNDDLAARPASGSFRLDAMAICPCSLKTLAGVAHGYSSTLIGRAAQCALKERRSLVLVLRESPYSLIDIKNMELVTQAGAIVLPASPAFWHRPKTIDELVSNIVERVLVHLRVVDNTEIEWDGVSQ